MRPHRRQPTRLCCPWDSPGKNTGVGCHFLLQCMKVKSESEVAQPCPTLSDPMDCSLPGSSMHGFSRQDYWSGVPLPSAGLQSMGLQHDLVTKQNVVDINVIMWGLSLLLFICTWELEVDKDNRIVWDYSLNYSFPMIWTERTTKGKTSLKQLLGELREQMSGKLLSKNSV